MCDNLQEFMCDNPLDARFLCVFMCDNPTATRFQELLCVTINQVPGEGNGLA